MHDLHCIDFLFEKNKLARLDDELGNYEHQLGDTRLDGHFGHIWPFMARWPSGRVRIIWASEVSLKRAMKM